MPNVLDSVEGSWQTVKKQYPLIQRSHKTASLSAADNTHTVTVHCIMVHRVLIDAADGC